MGLLHISQAEFHADGRRILGPISLDLVGPGITAILGANGSGKSVFLSLCHGILLPTRGYLTWDGDQPETTRDERGFVFQDTPILRRSVYDNIAFPLQAQNMPMTKRAPKIEQALRLTRLSLRANQPAASLSGGERQRLGLARALVIEPRVVFLDEPSASLDPASTKEFEEILTSISASGVKILLATHDIGQAKRMADDILFLDQGKLVEETPAEQFFQQPQSRAAQNYLAGVL